MVNRLVESGTHVQVNVPTKIESSIRTSKIEGSAADLEKHSVTEDEGNLKEELSSNTAKKMTESLNNFLETTNTKLRYEFHNKLEKYYVTLVNKETDEVVREIPNKKLMDMHAAMLDFVGILIDKKI